MIVITSKYNVTNPPLFASGHYYSKSDFQFPIVAFNQILTHPTVLKNNNGITLLYFSKGKGKIIINSKAYPIEKGILMCLASYHYFQLIPSLEPIELIQCKISYDTFLYMAANPYYKFSKITLNTHPLTSLLKEDNLDRVEVLLKELIETTNKNMKKEKANTQKDISQNITLAEDNTHKIGKKEFLLSMKLIGILHKTYRNDFWIQSNEDNTK